MLFEIIWVMENIDEVNSVNNSWCLHENYIPGASLGDRDRSALKFWSLSAGWYVGMLQQKEASQICKSI